VKGWIIITKYASEICWWIGCLRQICPVLETYEPTGFLKIRVMRTEVGFEDEPFEFEGWIDPTCVRWC
jgi:hypothetical protein